MVDVVFAEVTMETGFQCKAVVYVKLLVQYYASGSLLRLFMLKAATVVPKHVCFFA